MKQGKTILLTTTLNLPSTARLAMALTDCGCKVAVVNPPGHWIRYTTRVWKRLRYSGIRPLASLEEAIEATQPDLVIPCDDRAALHLQTLSVGANNENVSRVLRQSLCSESNFSVTQSRQGLMALAAREYVLVPENCSVSDVGELRDWLPDHPLPWVIKADGSWAGMGVRIVDTLAEAEAAYREMSRPVSARTAFSEAVIDWNFFWLNPWLNQRTNTISVQRFIEGRSSNCAAACWNGEMLGFIAVEVLEAGSRTGPATVVQVVDNPAMCAAVRRIVGALRFTGLVGFDFIVDDQQNAHMIEMNPRNVPLCHIPLGGEKDLVERLVARLEGRHPRDRDPVTNSDVITYFPSARLYRGLPRGYHDVPWEEPELLRKLLVPDVRERWMITQTKNLRNFIGKRVLRQANA
jgi:ATP-grasp domain